MEKKFTYLFVFCAALLFGTSVNASSVLVVPMTNTAKTIDGSADDWGSEWSGITEQKAASTTTATRGKFQIAYDQDNLYVIAVTTDASPHNEAALATYLRDCIEVFVALDTTSTTGLWGSRQYRFQRDGSGTEGLDDGDIGATVVSVETETGYIQEWSLPWDGIATREDKTDFDITEVKEFKFEIMVADNTDGTADGRTQQLYWNAGTDDQYNSSKNYGIAVLNNLEIAKTDAAKTIDGSSEDWGPDWIRISKAKAAGTTYGAKGKFQFAYDQDNLYLVAVVTDATPHNEAALATHLRDCVELFVALDTTTNTSLGGKRQYRFQRDGSDTEGLDDGGIGATVVSVSTETGYIQEWSLPWDGIATREGKTDFDITETPNFKFEIQVADNTDGTADGRTQQLYWNAGTDDQWGSSKNYGVVLVEAADPSSVVEISKTKRSLVVYPNPVKDQLKIETAESASVSVYNLTGKLVTKRIATSNITSIDFSAFNKGVYLVQVKKQDGTIITKKVVKN